MPIHRRKILEMEIEDASLRLGSNFWFFFSMGSFKISSTECVNLDIELEEQQQKLNRLWKWAEKHGANLESIKAVAYRQKTSTLPPINYSSSIYRGVIAVHEKREFDLIADIPESILLTESVARGSPVGVALTAYFESIGRQSSPLVLEAKWITAHNNNIRANGLLFIIVFMVYQQFELERDEAFYSPYLDSLPISYTTVPLFWTLEEMKKYIGVGTNLLNLLVNRLAVLKSGFELVHAACSSKFVKKPKALSWENFLWAYVSISSRAFPLLSGSISAGQGLHAINSSSNTSVGDDLNDDLKRDPTEVCMWPILDMFNHKLNQKIEWSTLLKPQHVSYIARDVCKVGEEINSNYGPKGYEKWSTEHYLYNKGFVFNPCYTFPSSCRNEMFLGAYGFVIDPNPNDYFKLTIQVSERDLLAARKRKLLEKCCISKSHLLFEREKDIAGAGEEQPIIISKSLMSALRVFCMNEHELTLKECDGDSKVIEPINPRNELSVLNALFTLMSEKLELIEQTIDIKASTGDRYSELDLEKIRMGRVYRDGKKERVRISEYIQIHSLSYLE